MKSWLKSFLLIFIVGAIYRDSFTSAFFQDDKILLNIANSSNPFAVIPNFPYRPISQEIFYRASFFAFGYNPAGYHLILFTFFIGTLVLIFQLAKFVLHDEQKSLVTVFFYALNVSLFANFYWIATSYFTIGAFFFFLTCYFYTKRKLLLTAISFILAIGSNEIALVLPLIFLAINWLRNYWPKWFWGFLLALPILLWLRLLIGVPQAQNYTLAFNGSAFATVRWYLIRALNLPEGVQRVSSPAIFALFSVTTIILVVSLIRYFRSKAKNMRLLLFGAFFFILCALPFFFLPNHMSSYYLTMALFGLALIAGEIIRGEKLTLLFCLCYMALTVTGLDFLSRTHWIILKNTGPIGKF